MALKHNLDKIRSRKWEELRDAWMNDVPIFPSVGARPDPGLEKLEPLQSVLLPKPDGCPQRIEDVDGLRKNALWEAVFLFHKCSHASLAAQRLGEGGMHSWCMFNAYHSAYLGAKGIMELLGVAPVSLAGKNVLLDLFPEPAKPGKKQKLTVKTGSRFNEFQIIQLDHLLDQQGLWEAFQRVLRISTVRCWDSNLEKEVKLVSCAKITPPRNAFLYKAHYWPLEDLTADAPFDRLAALIGSELDTDDMGFLFRLCFSVYRMFEQLISDLAGRSGVILQQVSSSRMITSVGLPVLTNYATFLSQMSAS